MSFTYPTLTTLLASMLLLTAGCASLDSSLDHPQGWGSRQEKLLPNGCPDLSGTYSTLATDAYPANAGTPPPLNEILGPGGLSDVYRQDRPWPALPGATTASFTSDGDWLYVHFGDDANGSTILRFKRKHWWGGVIDGSDSMYFCQELELGQALGLDGSRRPNFSVPYSITEHDVSIVFLSKGQDGSLIVNYRTVNVDVVRGIGIFGSTIGSIWWRYPPVEPTR